MCTNRFHRYLRRLAPALFLLIPLTGHSQSAERLKLDDLVGELLRSNPDVKAAELRYQAALTVPQREGALPDPRFNFGWMSASTILPGGKVGEDPNANIGFQVSQEFPYPGKRGLRTDVARKEADGRLHQRSMVARSRVAALKTAYYELAFTHESLDLLRESRDSLRQLSRVAEARYAVGQAMQQDLIRAETEVAILENRMLALEQRKQILEAEIHSLLNRPVTGALARPEESPLPALDSIESLLALVKQHSPDLQARNSMIEGRDAAVNLAKREYYPDFEIMTGYFYQGELDDMWEVRAEISIPIFYKSKQRKQVEEAALQLGEARQELRATEQMLEFRLRDAYVRAQTAQKLRELYARQIVPQSRMAFESSLAGYESGGVDFLTVFSNFTTILEYQMAQAEQKAEYLKACATLEELTGTHGAGEVQS